jgi:hypothetical protein
MVTGMVTMADQVGATGGSGALTQNSPTSVSVLQGAGYAGNITVSGAVGTVTYTENTSADSVDLTVSSSGTVTAPSFLQNGNYTVTGTDSDGAEPVHDLGTWTFTVTVGVLVQAAPFSASIPSGAGYSGQLAVTTSNGILKFGETTSTDSTDVTVSVLGVVKAATSLAVGTYSVSGTDSDSNTDAGAWTFTLTVGGMLPQEAPLSGDVPADTSYSGQLAVSGATGAVAYLENMSMYSTNIVVSSTGAVSYLPGTTPLAAGTYSVTGTDIDADNDTGTWTFTLDIGANLTQTSPTAVSVADGAGYSGQLAVSDSTGMPGTLTYVETASPDASDVVVSSTGGISSLASLSQGTYTVSGTESDTQGDTGTWSFSLTVTLVQQAPLTATVAAGAGFSGEISVAGATGAVTYTESPTGSYRNVTVSPSGAITIASGLADGSYSISGTDVDSVGDTGTWTFTLLITSGTLTQTSAASATVPDGTAYTGQLTVTNAVGTVSYTETPSANSGQVVVSTTGAISASSSLAPGTYIVGGTMADTSGDSGTWTFALTVNAFVSPPASSGSYDLVGSDGGVFVFGDGSGFYGSLPGIHVHVDNIVGIVPTSDDVGYFLVGSDGGVFAFGDAPFENSLPGIHVVVNDIVGIVPTTDDKGYYLVGRDGGVFAFGDAPFLNSLPGEGIHVDNIVGIATTPGDGGYWLVSSTGTVYDLGNAGALGNATSGPIVSITSTPSGTGYWLTSDNGTVSNFGNAVNSGSLPAKGVSITDIVSLVPSPDGGGYLLIGRDGGIFAFGDATFPGSLPGDHVVVDDIVGAVPT